MTDARTISATIRIPAPSPLRLEIGTAVAMQLGRLPKVIAATEPGAESVGALNVARLLHETLGCVVEVTAEEPERLRLVDDSGVPVGSLPVGSRFTTEPGGPEWERVAPPVLVHEGWRVVGPRRAFVRRVVDDEGRPVDGWGNDLLNAGLLAMWSGAVDVIPTGAPK